MGWYQCFWMADFGSQGDETGMQCKFVVQQLQASQLTMCAALDALDDHIAVIDSAGAIVFTNAAWRRFAAANGAVSPDAFVGRNYLHVCDDAVGSDAEVAHRVAAGLRCLLAGRRTILSVDYPCPTPSEPLWFRLRASAFELNGERFAILSHRDITPRVQAEEARRESEERHRLIFEQSPLGMALVGLDFSFLRVNEALCRITGYSAEELLSRGFPAITHPDDLEADLAQAHRLAAGEISQYTLEKRYLHKDGREIWVRLNGGILREPDGSPRYYLAQVEDITAEREAEAERHRAEQQRQESLQLESLGLLAGGIAHDFNNLLTVIIGNTHVALGELPPESPARATLVQVEQVSQRAADLTHQILAYAGRGRFVVEPLDVNQLIGELSPILHGSVARCVDLAIALSPELPAVEGDSTQLRRVLMNLVINASEAIGEGGGVVAIATRLLSADEAVSAGFELPAQGRARRYVLIEVADTGEGMEAATLRRIFEPFFTTKLTGRGLGLAAVQGIVRRHHGLLSARSEPGRGSTFSVLLPALQRKAPPRAVADQVRRFNWRGTALVIEDEPDVRSLLTRLLERTGFEVLSASDGRAGLELFRANATSLRCVFLDLTMLGMNGEETFHALKQIATNVPVVVTSGYAEEEVARRFAGADLAGFLPKPFTPASLDALLRAVLPPGREDVRA